MDHEDTRPKVAQILYSGLGGHGAVAFGIVGGDRDSRWRNAFGFVGIEPLLQSYRDQARTTGIEFAYIAATPRRPWRSWRPLFAWLLRTRPSAVILHSPTMIWPCLAYCRTRRVPLVVVEHQSNSLKSRHDWLASLAAMRLADHVVLLTEEYRSDMHARMGRAFRREKVSVIPNGIDFTAFARKTPFQSGAAVTIGMAARFTKTKLFPLLIAAFARLRAVDPRLNVRLSLAGDGEALEEARLTAEATEARDRIAFEGTIPAEDLPQWYRGLDIYCHISAGETLPMSIIQAMASGVPVIGSNVPGVAPLLADGQGVLVENDPDAIASAFVELCSNPARARLLGVSARRAAERRFDQCRAFQAYHGLLERIATASEPHPQNDHPGGPPG